MTMCECHECGLIVSREYAEAWDSGWVMDIIEGRWFCTRCLGGE